MQYLAGSPQWLLAHFEEINLTYFDGFLEVPELKINARLRSSAGRFIPGHRKFFKVGPPVIEVASYLLHLADSEKHVRDTIAHEMIHYWLWVRKKPFGHTPEFWSKMQLMGVSRYNPVPRYAYRCPACENEFLARRRLGSLACEKCCKQHANGRYDSRFKLYMVKEFKPWQNTRT